MRSASITPQDVAAVANQLIKTGHNPTIAAVRQGLGDRGSNSTIQKYLAEWRESFKEGNVQALPESLPEELLAPFEEIFNTAVGVAGQKHDGERKEFESKLQGFQTQLFEMETKLSAAVDENSRLHDGHEKQRQAIVEMHEGRKKLESELEAQTKLAYERERELLESQRLNNQREVDYTESYERLKASHQEEVERFKGVIEDHKVQMAKESERYDAQNIYWAKQVDQARTEGEVRVRKLEKQVEDLDQKLDSERQKKEEVLAKLGSAMEEAAAQRVNGEGLTAQLTRLATSHEKCQADYLTLRESLASMATERQAQDRIIGELKVRIEELTAELKREKRAQIDDGKENTPGGESS